MEVSYETCVSELGQPKGCAPLKDGVNSLDEVLSCGEGSLEESLRKEAVVALPLGYLSHDGSALSLPLGIVFACMRGLRECRAEGTSRYKSPTD